MFVNVEMKKWIEISHRNIVLQQLFRLNQTLLSVMLFFLHKWLRSFPLMFVHIYVFYLR